MYRPTYINVDCNKLENNIKKIISNHSKYDYFFGIVKNNAYHHGIYAVNHMIDAGINYLAVSSLEEAIQVRKYNNEISILCLEPIKKDYICDVINNNITLTISSEDEALSLLDADIFEEVKIHLKIDSGMNRLGFKDKKELKNAYKKLREHKKINIEGLYTHLATDGIYDNVYKNQVNKFKDIISAIPYKEIKIIHIDRSNTLLLHEKLDFVNGARLGICMYGIETGNNPSIKTKIISCFAKKGKKNKEIFLEPVLSFYSEVIQLRKPNKGEFVGYNAGYHSNGLEYIATIPCGYADGVLKKFKYIYINDNKYEIVAECMDMIMVSVDETVKIGDKVEIVGENQTINILSSRLNMVEHKTLTLFSNRVPIRYIYNENTYEVKY